MYYVMAENGVGGRAFEWARHLFGYGDDVAGALADAAARSRPARCQFLPWLLGSIAPQPNDDVRAAFVGMSLQHDRRHVMRATLEGVALNLAWLLPPSSSSSARVSAPSLRWWRCTEPAVGAVARRRDRPTRAPAGGAARHERAWCRVPGVRCVRALDLADVPSLLHTAHVHEPNPAAAATSYAPTLAGHVALHPALSSLNPL
jgi:hypothetical protein